VIEHLAESAGEVLVKGLGYRAIDTISFSILLSEICQNVIEHAEAPGWVAIQAYKHHRASGGPAVQIAVADAGMGVRNSLARDHAARYGERWDDATALEAAFVQGVTRFRDPGRGQGLRQVRRTVAKWGGAICIRSGTARIGDAPTAPEMLETGLAPLPGVQVRTVLPGREAG
jgi:hypothetical protein